MAWLAGFGWLAAVIVSVLAVRRIRVQAKEIGALRRDDETNKRKIKRLDEKLALARKSAFDDRDRRRVFDDQDPA